jgi:GNAT superfamily N-acetyltransferase
MTTITRIKELDLQALDELRRESSQEGYRFVERLCDEWASGTNRFSAPGEALFLATVGDLVVVGVCGLNRDSYVPDPSVGRVRRLYVARAHGRVGVGRALLEAVLAHAREHFRRLRLRSEVAGEFYLTHGFRRIASETDTTHAMEITHAAGSVA